MAADNTVSTPRIDRKFVDERGNLTQNAYALLDGLIKRTGGVTAEIIDTQELRALMDEANIPSDVSGRDALTAVDELRNALASSRSDVQRLARRIDELAELIAEVRPGPDLSRRVEQIEERLQ